MTTLLAFAFVLGVLVFVHELGHFLAARWNGVRVLTFSVGFGPKLLKFRRGDTEYCVSAIPLGGYVKMAGENPEDPRSGQPDEFLSKNKWQRFQILIMGFGGGYWLDGWLGTRPWLSFFGFFLGLGAGVLNVYRVMQATSQTGSTGPSSRGPGTPAG